MTKPLATKAVQTCVDCKHDDQSKAARMYGCSEDAGDGYCNCQNQFHRKCPAVSVSEAQTERDEFVSVSAGEN